MTPPLRLRESFSSSQIRSHSRRRWCDHQLAWQSAGGTVRNVRQSWREVYQSAAPRDRIRPRLSKRMTEINHITTDGILLVASLTTRSSPARCFLASSINVITARHIAAAFNRHIEFGRNDWRLLTAPGHRSLHPLLNGSHVHPLHQTLFAESQCPGRD